MALSPALAALVKGAKNKYSRNNSRSVKLKEGKTTVRILQPKPDEKFWADLGVHWIKMEKNGKPVAVVGCRDVVNDEPCPICQAIEKAAHAATDDDSLAIIKEWKAKKSVLVNALIRSGSDASEDPVVLEMTPTTFGTILSMAEQYGDETNIFDAKTGIDFVIERKGKGLDTEYTVMPSLKPNPVPASALEKCVDLDEFIEKEFFRGDETKALNAITQMTGISVPAIGRSTSALLTSAAASVAEEVEETPEVVATPATAKATVTKPKPAPVEEAKPASKGDDFGAVIDEEDMDSILSELEGL
ncbi:hypothetical protein SAMN05216548_114106 [Faunimonas pinastri]|uniref:Bacteriophage T4 Gp32 single-stranded DNA-binding domain-containing protein n=1 Tax=Faunimonas pinastri TaxID=1855383 RepID=A0A1H9MYD4_9HYPH|nr:hypothetical protein [Faunimonas pinastri]SER28678.1 hypothetical protein SAMN05216548_114106 [Faunimonas pinastri]